MKILAVDDDESIRELLSMILAEAGIADVTVASSAKNALSAIAAQATPFECFLLDIQMPGGDGIELCSDIRKLPPYQKTPILMLTAMREKSFIEDSFAVGATDYVSKPFDIAELLARVKTAKALVDERRKVRDLQRKVQGLWPATGIYEDISVGNPSVDFSERLDFGGVKGLVTIQAFENFLGQFSHIGLETMSFFAVHLQDGGEVFGKCSASEIEYALRHVADAILVSHLSGTVIMYYAGSGNFICSSNAATMDSAEWLENNIQDTLDNKDLTLDDGTPLDIEIAVGATAKSLLTSPLRLDVLEPQVIKRVMARVGKKRSTPAAPNIRRTVF